MTPDRPGHLDQSWVPQVLILMAVGGLAGMMLLGVVWATVGVGP
jgi:hypothetical protein